MARWLLLVCVLSLVIPAAGFSRTWYIKSDGSGDAATIQDGINVANPGDSVVVAQGTYCENIRMRNWVTLCSELGPELTTVNGGASGLVILCESVQGCTVAGFTLTNGRSVNGGGVLCTQSTGIAIRGNRIIENTGLDSGAGIYWHLSSGIIEWNLIANNSVVGIYCSYASPEIGHNTISSNLGPVNLTLYYSSPGIHHNIVVNGQAGIRCEPGSYPTLWCNDVWGHTDCDYCCITVPVPGSLDISMDPLFCDPDNMDFRIDRQSPCANQPGCGLVGAYGPACGATGIEGNSWGAIKSMYR
ncbi:MAG: NosD domain-containing protein [Candidatus Eisenbacteria bacterium]